MQLHIFYGVGGIYEIRLLGVKCKFFDQNMC